MYGNYQGLSSAEITRAYHPRKLPGLILLKGQDQNNTPEDAGQADEFLTAHFQHAVHKEYLRQDKAEGESDENDLPDRFFGFPFKDAEDGDHGKENADKRSHSKCFS
jgi:hypothetical protein